MKDYIVHGHVERADGTKHSFWTRTGLSRSEARALVKEQTNEGGGARIDRANGSGL